MWSVETFKKLRLKCRDESDEGGTVICTYSQATPVRVALLLAGFFVGAGPATGLKEETTQASTDFAALDQPLGADWLRRWSRSRAQAPYGNIPHDVSDLGEWLGRHSQFA